MSSVEMRDIAEVLIPGDAVHRRVAELAAAISRDYLGKELVCVGILKGAIHFFSALTLRLEIPAAIDFMAISSYGAATRSSGVVQLIKDLSLPVDGRHVLIIEDIVDTGLTLHYILENIAARRAASVKACTLLDKPERRLVTLCPDYCGFAIENRFVVGYGLDYDERYRNLSDICVLKPGIYENEEVMP